MSSPFVAEIRIFACNFPPTGWAFCNGQLLPISQNTALFALLGTTYGGDGRSTFALPDLRGRAPMHPGPGPGLSSHHLGEAGGSEAVTLLEEDVPAHTHGCLATTRAADTRQVGPTASFARSTGGTLYHAASDVALASAALAPAGGGASHNNMMPYLAVPFCIALQGVFPPRA